MSKLRNIGKVSGEWLANAGIHSVEDLQEFGVIKAYCVIKSFETKVSLNLLWALEGAVQNLDFREITTQRKTELLNELNFYI